MFLKSIQDDVNKIMGKNLGINYLDELKRIACDKKQWMNLLRIRQMFYNSETKAEKSVADDDKIQ